MVTSVLLVHQMLLLKDKVHFLQWEQTCQERNEWPVTEKCSHLFIQSTGCDAHALVTHKMTLLITAAALIFFNGIRCIIESHIE